MGNATSLWDLPTPSLVVDLDVVERNLAWMAARARRLGVALRPHTKTHKYAAIADLQRQQGAVGLTVATLGEAEMLVEHGHTDLTWAFPVILSQIPRLLPLLERAILRLVVDSPEAVDALERQLAGTAHVWLKVDCGYHRAGVDPEGERLLELARRLTDSPRFVFDGILSHSGQAYDAPGVDRLRAAAEDERRVMVGCAERLRAAGVEVPGVSVGSTPAMSVTESLEGITEARAGNYVFYDLTQHLLGACELSDCAATVLASVGSSQPGAGHCVIDAGALSLSKDPGPSWAEPPSFGRPLEGGALDPELRLVSLSQEHGILSAALPVGRRLRILPNHSCLAVPNFERYVLVRGEEVVGSAPIWHGR